MTGDVFQDIEKEIPYKRYEFEGHLQFPSEDDFSQSLLILAIYKRNMAEFGGYKKYKITLEELPND